MNNTNAKRILKKERAAKKKLKNELLVLLLMSSSVLTYESYFVPINALLIKTFYEKQKLSKQEKTMVKTAAANLTAMIVSALIYETLYENKSYKDAAEIAINRAEKKIATIARTEATRSVNMETLTAAGGRIKLVWNAILDNRVCSECEDLDGEMYDPSKQQPPPLHTNCRCSLEVYSNNR